MKAKTVMITGGGTGGHLSPGAAIYEELKKRGLEVVVCAGKADRRFSIMQEFAPGDLVYYGAPAFTKNIFRIPFFIISFLSAMRSAGKVMRKRNVGAIIGMGGYVSAPALMAARRRKIPLFLCEQNSVPGKVTAFFEQKARRIYGTFMVSRDFLRNSEAFLCAGNPIRKHVLEAASREEARRAFHLEHCRRVILVIGGSQGALKLNRLIYDLKKNYPNDFKDGGIIWSTGAASYQTFRDRVQNEMEGGSIYLSEYIDRVGLAYRAADIAISRSGAGVMMELAAAGVPSILIPYPFAAMDHQDKNAEVFVREGAAVKIKDSEAVAEKVAPVLFDILHNDRKLQRMSRKALESARPSAASDIVDDIIISI